MARKILFYTNAFDGGGAEVVFARLSRALAEVGHNVIFAADHASGPVVEGVNPVLKRLPSEHGHAIFRLAALLRREKPDVSFSALGSHNFKHVVASALAGRLSHCVLGVHGFAAAEPQCLSRLSFWATPLLTRLSAHTICVSDVLRADLIHRWHASQIKVMRIHNPLPSTIAPARCVQNKDAPPLVLACGRLVPIKRFVDLVFAFAEVAPRTARLAILGEGRERPAIDAAIRLLHLEDRVDLPGHVDPSSWYRRATCLAVTSESESFGLSVAEALAHGVAVVSTDCGGPREILDDGRYGRLVPVGDRQALTAAITATLASPGDPAPRIDRARAFSITKIRDAYAALADQLA